MDISDSCMLSAYRVLAPLEGREGISVVQNIYSGKLFVRKDLTTYNRSVYEQLKENPVKGMPQIYEVIEQDDTLTVIEEYVAGDTLGYLLDNAGPMSEERVVSISLALCDILSRLHGCNPPLIHRDIKPENIIMTTDGVVKLLDLNAARRYEDGCSRDTCLIGTAGYAAPEQYGFRQSGIETDIYSLGILMNVLLTGELPVDTPAGGPLGRVIRTCTRMAPEERYASAEELKQAIEAAGEASAERRSPRRFLPPGFRSGNPSHMAFATAGYALAFSLTTAITNPAGGVHTVLDRVFSTLWLALAILFTGNYLGIQSLLPLTRSGRKWVRFLGILLYDILLLILILLLQLAAEALVT